MAVSADRGGPIVFLDKDGTLVEDIPHNVDPQRMRLTPNAGAGVAALAQHGFRIAVITNQPGVARGLFALDALTGVERRLRELLSRAVPLAGFYFCPHDATGGIAPFNRPCRCRKPAPGLLLRAARELQADLGRCWFVGDILDDVEAGRRAGCRTVLLDRGHETEWQLTRARTPHHVAADLMEAARCIIADTHAMRAPILRVRPHKAGAS